MLLRLFSRLIDEEGRPIAVNRRVLLRAVPSALVLALCAGCQSNPFATKPSATPADLVKYGPTSAQKIKQLQEQAAAGPGSDSALHELRSSELAGQIKNEEDPLVRIQIIRTISIYPTRLAGAVLHAANNDPDALVRVACCEAWGKRGGDEAVQNLKDRLQNDDDVDVRLAAARGLGATNQKAAVDALAIALEDPNPALQFRAVESLKTLSGMDLGEDVNKWRAYVQTPVDRRPQPTLADRLGVNKFF